MEYRAAAAVLTTENGKRLAAGCICEAKAYDACMEDLQQLSEYKAVSRDLVGIDFELAERICALLSHKSVIAAGASIRIEDAEIPEGFTTGGILGDPEESPESSEDETEGLRDGFSMMTLSGSPGLCADAAPDTVEELLYIIKKLKDNGELTAASLEKLFDSFHINTALLIFDGTGSGQEAFLAVKDNKNVKVFM